MAGASRSTAGGRAASTGSRWRRTSSRSRAGASCWSVVLVGGHRSIRPAAISASASRGVSQRWSATSWGSGTTSAPSGSQATKNRVSYRRGLPGGVTQRDSGTRASRSRAIPTSSASSRIAAAAKASGSPGGRSGASAASTAPPGNTCRPGPKAIVDGRRVSRTSGPRGPGRMRTTVEAGRGTTTGAVLGPGRRGRRGRRGPRQPPARSASSASGSVTGRRQAKPWHTNAVGLPSSASRPWSSGTFESSGAADEAWTRNGW